MSAPPIRYAANGDIHIAYRVLGDAPIDLVMAAGAFTNLDVLWEISEYRDFHERLARFARVIMFDKRGMGLSDRARFGTLEERMDDVRAILDDVGSTSAVLMGASEGGPMSILFAATYPERTRALILCGAEIKEETTKDWPWGETTREQFEEAMQLDQVVARWGKGQGLPQFIPARKDDERLRELWGRLQVQAASPHDAIAFMRMAFEIDVRHVVPSVTTPALILHRVGDKICHVENARWLSRHLPNAKYVELPGDNHLAFVDGDDIIDEIREFLTGVREPAEPERVLATVLFTDIVGSTERARELGDGFLATFDGPARAIRSAKAIVDSVRTLGLEIRAGLHTGEVELAGDAVRGIAVHTGARVASAAGPSEVLVSQTVKDLVAGAGIEFEDRGARELKGVPGEWRLYAVR